MLEVHDLTRSFGRLKAVDGVSLTVPPGEIRGLIGPNGSGKTTLFNVVSGFLRPTGGTVRFGGEDITGWRPHRIAARGLVRTFQIASTYSDMTVLENVRMGEYLAVSGRRNPVGRFAADAEGLIEFMGLSAVRQVAARSLPAGTQRILSIATALAARPAMLLLDEPLAGLNASEKSAVIRRIADLRSHGLAVLLVEHDVRSVTSVCDCITVIEAGRMIAEGRPDAIMQSPEVLRAYIGGAFEAHA